MGRKKGAKSATTRRRVECKESARRVKPDRFENRGPGVRSLFDSLISGNKRRLEDQKIRRSIESEERKKGRSIGDLTRPGPVAWRISNKDLRRNEQGRRLPQRRLWQFLSNIL